MNMNLHDNAVLLAKKAVKKYRYKSQAAKALGISEPYLRRLLKK